MGPIIVKIQVFCTEIHWRPSGKLQHLKAAVSPGLGIKGHVQMQGDPQKTLEKPEPLSQARL